MESHASGWIREEDVVSFFSTKCSFSTVCFALSQAVGEEDMEILLQFLESITRFPIVGLQLIDPANSELVLSALGSPSERLRSVIVASLSSVKTPSFPFQVTEDILQSLLSDDDTGISSRASKMIEFWISRLITDTDARQDFVKRLLNLYKSKSAALTETQAFRFISLFTEISKQEDGLFELIRRQGVFDSIISRFLSSESDLLVKLGSLTLIEPLSQFENGQRFLAEANVLSALESELSGPLADSTTQISLLLSIAAIVPFVPSTEQIRTLLVYSNAHVPRLLSQFIVSVNNSERMCAMKVLASLSLASNRSEPVQAYLRANWRTIKELAFAMSDVDVEIVNTAIDSLRTILKNWDRNPYMESEDSQCRFISDVFNSFKRHPFPECRCLVYSLLSVVVQCEDLCDSALSLILSEPSPIRAALLDFRSESSYDSRRAKCDFVRVLVRSEPKVVLNKFFTKEQVENFIDFSDKGIEWVPVSKAKDEMETEAL
jgi:hypothetical protein